MFILVPLLPNFVVHIRVESNAEVFSTYRLYLSCLNQRIVSRLTQDVILASGSLGTFSSKREMILEQVAVQTLNIDEEQKSRNRQCSCGKQMSSFVQMTNKAVFLLSIDGC